MQAKDSCHFEKSCRDWNGVWHAFQAIFWERGMLELLLKSSMVSLPTLSPRRVCRKETKALAFNHFGEVPLKTL